MKRTREGLMREHWGLKHFKSKRRASEGIMNMKLQREGGEGAVQLWHRALLEMFPGSALEVLFGYITVNVPVTRVYLQMIEV